MTLHEAFKGLALLGAASELGITLLSLACWAADCMAWPMPNGWDISQWLTLAFALSLATFMVFGALAERSR